MGQYYKPIILTKGNNIKAWGYAHEYENGLKLMEHSWIGNNFVARIVKELIGKAQKIVWAGDYADAELDKEGNERKSSEGYEINLYSLCTKGKKLPIEEVTIDYNKHRYLVNHDTKEYVDMVTLPSKSQWGSDWQVHPLPLLTCEGNGRGGGDFRADNDYIGKWARNYISVQETIPEGFAEIKPDFIEE